MPHRELDQMRESSPEDSYIIRIAPGYIGVVDLNKEKSSATPKPARKPAHDPAYRKISVFSKRSRNRLIQDLNRLRFLPNIFVTLTFPEYVTPARGHLFKSPLNNLAREIRRDHPNGWFFWRLEPHKNDGRPHFHLLGSTKTAGEPESVRGWFHQTWAKIIGIDHNHFPRLTDVSRVYGNFGSLCRDFSKPEIIALLGKYTLEWNRAGHRWGRINKKAIPYGDVIEREVKWELFNEIKYAVLDHLQAEINEIETKLATKPSGMSSFEARKLRDAIIQKQQFHRNVAKRHDFFAILNADHIELVKEVIRDWDREEELRMTSGEPV